MQTKLDANKNPVISEMIATEITYNNGLVRLEQGLDTGLATDPSNALFIQLKDQVVALKVISETLLQNIERAMTLDITAEEHTPLRQQRVHLLTEFFRHFRPYAELVTEYHAQSAKVTGIDALLITPIQRGPRYALMVTAAKKTNAHLSSENLVELEQLEALILDSLSLINSQMRGADANSPEGYYLGKYTHEYILGPVQKYQFGDLTRGAVSAAKSIATFFCKAISGAPAAQAQEASQEAPKDEDDNDSGFTLV